MINSCNDDPIVTNNHAIIIFKNNSDRAIICLEQNYKHYNNCHNSAYCEYLSRVIGKDTNFFRSHTIQPHSYETVMDFYTIYELDYELDRVFYLVDYDSMIIKQFKYSDYSYENIKIATFYTNYEDLKANNWAFSYP